MPVIDASVVVAYLLGSEHARAARAVLLNDERTLWAPHLIDAEVGHVVRRTVAAGAYPAESGADVLEDLLALPLVRAAHTGLLRDAWDLRENVSFYDALYVALAARIRAPLITLDARLARAASGLVDVELLSLA